MFLLICKVFGVQSKNMNSKNETKIIILAGGKGTRMGGDLPKVLMQVNGKSMIEHVLESVNKSKIDTKPTIIVGYKKELVIGKLGNKYHYINQEEQLGTGHAVSLAKKYLKNKANNIIVLYGDHPLISIETIKKINDKHLKSKKKITMATVKLKNFEDWRVNFLGFSRVIRDKNGKIIRTVEKKDSTEEERKIKEVNPCYFCFDSTWLWQNLEKLENNNAQKEYYLTDLIKIATTEGIDIESIEIDAHEALGANSKEELEILKKLCPHEEFIVKS